MFDEYAVGCEKCRRLITPKVQQPLAGFRVEPVSVAFLELVYRKQFDCRDPELPEVWNFVDQSGERSWISHSGRFVFCEAAHMQLVDDAVGQRQMGGLVMLPVEAIFGHQTIAIGSVTALVRAPWNAV